MLKFEMAVMLGKSKAEVQSSSISSSGAISLQDFSELETHSRNVEKLKSIGLTQDEINIYLDHKKGSRYLESAHKNMEKIILMETVKMISNKIEMANRTEESQCMESVAGTSNKVNKEYSIDPNFIIKRKNQISNLIPLTHPINRLDVLNDDLFGHMDVDKLPSANKRRKILRRMERKFAKDILIPEPAKEEIPNSNDSLPNSSHSYNEFVKSNSNSVTMRISETATPQRNPNSKWDLKDMSKYKITPTLKNVDRNDKKSKTPIGCKPQTLYTIKDNRIVRLEKKQDGKTIEKSSENIMKYVTVEIKLPINKAEEKLLEGTRLSLEDIKRIPKFENYNPGVNSKTLFIKNLSNNIRDEDLLSLLCIYDNNVTVNVMTGRMRGQAFATFTSTENATQALNKVNGTILKGKPIIILYGKGGKGS